MRIVGMNNLMARLYSPDCGREGTVLPRSLDNVIDAGIVSHEGCYVFRSEFAKSTCAGDRTGYESFVNHIHLKDHGDDRLPVAFAFLRKTSLMLQKDFPGVDFLGDISCEPDGQGCIVRFYSKHQGEPPLLMDDLEDYKFDAVCLLDLASTETADTE